MTFHLVCGCTQIRFHTSLRTLLYNAKSRIYITANKNADHSSPPSSGAVSSHANHLPTSLIACTPHSHKQNSNLPFSKGSWLCVLQTSNFATTLNAWNKLSAITQLLQKSSHSPILFYGCHPKFYYEMGP